jgi:outer membrane cobalamin receptor
MFASVRAMSGFSLFGPPLASFLLLTDVAAAATPRESFRDLSLAQAIGVLERRGLLVIYSSDLVKPWMRIRAEPAEEEPEKMLAEILAPFGLRPRPLPSGALAVVSASHPSAKATEVSENRTAADLPRPHTDNIPVTEIIVAASRYELTNSLTTVVNSFSAPELQSLPDLGDDALRAVARLPGTANNGLTARVNVRGGDSSETLVRFDGVRLYNPFHLKDFQSLFGAVDPSIVGSVDVYTGGFGANYGDRMSGVIDITSLAPPAPRYSEVNVSFFNTSALNAGRFSGDRGEWIASVRRSNLDLWYSALSNLPSTPSYVDGFGKLSYQVNDALRVSAGTLYFADEISLVLDDGDEQASAHYTDRYYWVRLDEQPSADISGTTVFAHAALDGDRAGVTDKEGVSHGDLTDRRSFNIDSVQTDWSWLASDTVRIEFGGEARRAKGRYDYRDHSVFDVRFDMPGALTTDTRNHNILAALDTHSYALYTSVRYGIAPYLTTDVGLRLESQRLGPRLGIRYQLDDRTSVHASWGRVYQSQSIDELPVADGITSVFQPQRADQATLGFEHRSPYGIDLRAEIYDKRLSNLHPRYENFLDSLTLVPELEPDRIELAPASGRARGLEILLSRRDASPLRWWIAYSWSSTTERIDGADVPRGWDQPHALSAGFDWNARQWKIGAALIQRSGWPTTAVALEDSESTPSLRVSPRNSARMALFRTVDARVERRFAFDHSLLTTFLEVENLLGRRNPCCTAYEIDDEGDNGLELQRRDYLPRIPSLGFLWQF